MSGKYGVITVLFSFLANVINADISGTLSFKDADGSSHSLDYATVKILDGGNTVATTTTNGSGSFTATISSNPSSYTIKVETDTSNVKVCNTGGGVYSMTSSSQSASSVTYTYGYSSSASEAFYIQKYCGRGHAYADNLKTQIGSTDTISKLTAYYPASNTYYMAGTINISSTDSRDDSVILHEYGHHVHACFSTIPMGGTHYTDGIYDKKLSWTEGFASYFASAVRGSVYSIFNIDIDNLTQKYPRSSGNELRISAALYNLHNATGGGAVNIFKTLDAMEYPYYRSIFDFYQKWIELGFSASVTAGEFEKEGIYVNGKTEYSIDFDNGAVSGGKVNYNWPTGWGRHQTDPKPEGIAFRGDNQPGVIGGASYSGSNSLNYNNDDNYNGGFNYGYAESPIIDLKNMSKPYVEWKCNYETDDTSDSTDKRRILIVSVDTGATIYSETLSTKPGSNNLRECHGMGFWHTHVLNLNPAWGNVFIQFYFTTVNANNNNHSGWFIDDVAIKPDGSGILPFAPTNMEQYKKDGTKLAKSEISEAKTIMFKANLNSADADDECKFQVEVKAYNERFDGSVTAESNFVTSGDEASIIADVPQGDRKWRGRVVSRKTGKTSDWFAYSQSAPEGEVTDFIVESSSKDSGGGGGGGGGGGCGGTITVHSNSNIAGLILVALALVSLLHKKISEKAYCRA